VKKYISALLYAIQIPVSVWAGISLDRGRWWLGCGLIGAMMVTECVAVLTFMDGQTDDIATKIKTPSHSP
jgi:hypothetical protein